MTTNSFFSIYENYQKQHMAYRTWYPRTNLIQNHALPIIGDLQIFEVTSAHIDQIYTSMEESGLKQNTIFGMAAALRSFFKLAMERGYISETPMANARTIRQDFTV